MDGPLRGQSPICNEDQHSLVGKPHRARPVGGQAARADRRMKGSHTGFRALPQSRCESRCAQIVPTEGMKAEMVGFATGAAARKRAVMALCAAASRLKAASPGVSYLRVALY